VNSVKLLSELVADARLDEDVVGAGAHQQGVEAERDGITLIGLDALFPHDTRDDAEHRAAIGAVCSVGENRQLEVADCGAMHKVSPQEG